MGNNLRKFLLNNNNYVEYSRDSFSHRICDDLCEVILQYLSLEDKIRFECVSQQFQRKVFQRQHMLRIDYTTSNIFKRIRMKSFEKLLKKCPNITSVYIMNNFRHIFLNIWFNDCIEMICRNCQYLRKIHFDFMIDDQLLEKFSKTFEARLKSFECVSLNCSEILKIFKSIESLDLITCDYKNIQDHKFSMLKNLKVHLYDENSDYLLKFIQNNHDVEKLSVNLDINDPFYANSILMELSKLKNLFHFSFTNFSLNEELFDEALTRMAVNCSQLKSIVCRLKTYSKNYYEINELLSPLKQFKHLKSLDLSFELSISDDQNINSVNLSKNSIKPLTGFEGLTRLTLSFNGYSTNIIEEIVFNILITLENIRFLDIKTPFYPTRRTANMLSQMSQLELVKINMAGIFLLPSQWEHIENKLLESCKYIKSVEICS